MSANHSLAVTINALQRVLHHLSEEQQAKHPDYIGDRWVFTARAEARVIVKRRLAHAKQSAEMLWNAAKERV